MYQLKARSAVLAMMASMMNRSNDECSVIMMLYLLSVEYLEASNWYLGYVSMHNRWISAQATWVLDSVWLFVISVF